MGIFDVFRKSKKCEADNELECELEDVRQKAKEAQEKLNEKEQELHQSIGRAITAGGAAHETISSLPEGAWRELQARMAEQKQGGQA